MAKVVFSPEQLPDHLDAQKRHRIWLDLFASHMCSAEVSFFADKPLYSASTFLTFGNVHVTELHASIRRAERSRRHIASDTRGDYIIGAMLNGTRSLLKQHGREAVRSGGESMLYTNAEPLLAEHDAEVAFRGVTVPHARLAERVQHFEDLVIKPLAPSPALHHLERYLSLLIDSDLGADPLLEARIDDYLVDLAALALGAQGDSAELSRRRGLRAARLQEIRTQISRSFMDRGFSVGTVAQRLGLSERYVHDLLQESGTSLTQRVLELRLQKARAMLEDRRHDRRKVSEIAEACGFNDVSYFNRCFRRRFGASPTQLRGASDAHAG
jgi:AraC-like DNA-binding protein